MVVIRLSRKGAKKRPFYHIVVADSRFSRDGRFLERLGYFDPMAAGEAVMLKMNLPRADYWIGVGAQPSKRVGALIKQYRKLPAEKVAA